MPEHIVQARVLGQLLLLQGTIQVLPTGDHIGAFVARGLESIPGVSSIHLCIRGRSVYENDNYKEPCSLCKDLWNESDDALGFQCKLKGFRGIRCLQIATESRLYGFINLFLDDADAFVLYEPYIRNIANLIALTMESKRQRNLLEALNRQLLEDIAEHKQMEEVIKDSEKKYRTLVDNSLVGIYRTNLKGEFLYTNHALTKIFEFQSREEMMAKAVQEIYKNPKDRDVLIENLKERAMVKNFELEVFTKTGKTKNVLISASLEGDTISGMVHDITEHKRAEQELRESEMNLKAAQKIAHVGSWDWDVVTGNLTWSDETYRIYGFEPQEFVPTYEKFLFILHPEDHEQVQKHVDAALSGEAEYDVDFRFVRPDGKIGWIYCNGEVTRDKQGKSLRFFGTQIDITERKQAEKEREKLIAELQEALKNVKTLSSLLPICMSCKKIRDDKGYWNQIEEYITEHTDTLFSHGVCPDCLKKMYSDFDKEDK